MFEAVAAGYTNGAATAPAAAAAAVPACRGRFFAPALFAGDRRMGAPKIYTVDTSPRNRERNDWERGTSAGDALGTRGR